MSSPTHEAVLEATQQMYTRGLVEGTAGNVSGRMPDGNVVMTPSSVAYEGMTVDDLVVVDLDGNVVDGERGPTSEKALHLACYRSYDEVGGVIHCHATYASMFALVRQPIPAVIEEFVVFVGGDVPIAEYKPTGSDELAEEIATHLTDRSVALMANHGILCIGRDPADALHAGLVVEHNARIIWGAKALGEPVPIPDKNTQDFTGVYEFVRGHTWGTWSKTASQAP
jgi:L-fuculose-phosphate aldolase